MAEQIGPSEIRIPAQRYNSCSGCKFYKSHMVRSGRDPKYARNCLHPSLPSGFKYRDMLTGNLPEEDETPDWCPVVNAKSNA